MYRGAVIAMRNLGCRRGSSEETLQHRLLTPRYGITAVNNRVSLVSHDVALTKDSATARIHHSSCLMWNHICRR